MILRKQEQLVERLSVLAGEREAQATARRQAYRRWKQRRLGNFDALAWIFAAGAVWGLVRPKQAKKSQSGRLVLGAANLGLLAWRHMKKSEATASLSSVVAESDVNRPSQQAIVH